MARHVVSRHHFPRAEARAAIVPWCQDFYNVKNAYDTAVKTANDQSCDQMR